jgi:hypothetical protein
MRMLICDGHDSHISAAFIYHCMQNRIVLLLLPPHSSHLMQPLDVGVFGPLKTAISAQLARLISTGVPRLQKMEWLENYVPARAKAITSTNIEGGWRGAGIFPINRAKILRNLPRELTTQSLHQPQMQPVTPFETQLLTSSPPNATDLHSTNCALKEALQSGDVNTPVKKYVGRLAKHSERLHASNTILRQENQELKKVISTRKERASGKRVALKNVIIASVEDVFRSVEAAEKKTNKAKLRRAKDQKLPRKRKQASVSSLTDSSEDEDESTIEKLVIEDCIEVKF